MDFLLLELFLFFALILDAVLLLAELLPPGDLDDASDEYKVDDPT